MSDSKDKNQDIKIIRLNQSNEIVDYKLNYDNKETEIVQAPEKLSTNEVIKLLLVRVIAGIIISLILSFMFKFSYLSYLGSFFSYLFLIGGLMMVIGSFSALYSESPTMQVMMHPTNTEKVNVKKHGVYLLLYSGIITIILSLFLSTIFSL